LIKTETQHCTRLTFFIVLFQIVNSDQFVQNAPVLFQTKPEFTEKQKPYSTSPI